MRRVHRPVSIALALCAVVLLGMVRATAVDVAPGATPAGADAPDGRAGISPTAVVSGPTPHAREDRPVVVRRAARADRSPALGTIAPAVVRRDYVDKGLTARRQLGARLAPGGAGTTGAPTPDGALKDEIATAAVGPSPHVAFDGVPNVNGLLPPDPTGEVGPDHYVQWVNASLAVFSRDGRLLYGPAGGNTLWRGFGGPCETRNDGDPIVQYDQLADRWLLSQFSIPGRTAGYHQCVAVSATGDPLGAWYRYDFLVSTRKMNDYPKFGVWPDGYYLSFNQFTNGTSWGGAGVAVLERDRLLAGDPGARMIVRDLYAVDQNLGGLLPADLDGAAPPAGTPNVFAVVDDGAWGYTNGIDQLQLWEFSVDWSSGSSSFSRRQTIPVAAFDADLCGGSRSCIPQRSSTARLDPIPDRLMYRLAYRTLDGTPTLLLDHSVDADGSDRAGIRWYQLAQGGDGEWSIRQQATWAPRDGVSRWMASVGANRVGDIALGYSASGPALDPSLRLAGRLGTDPPDGRLTQGEGSLVEGTGAQTATASRWGDYTHLSVDPRDDCTFWYTGPYVASTGTAPWRTRIGAMRLSWCGATAGRLAGTVVDRSTGTPLAGASITLESIGTTAADAAGAFAYQGLYPDRYVVRATAPGYIDASAGVIVPSGGVATAVIALDALGSSGPVAPVAAAAGPGGDGNGYETNGGLASFLAADGNAASDVRSGTKSGSQCDASTRDSHLLGVPIAAPLGRAVAGISVRLRAAAASTSGSPRLCVSLTWDSGATWTDPKPTAGLTTAFADLVVGSPTDPWQVGRADRSWTIAELRALRVRVLSAGTSTTNSYLLDALSVTATYR